MNINAETLTVNGVEYVAVAGAGVGCPVYPMRIVILQRGWVVVGRYTPDETECVLTDAKVIRRWGSKAGLGFIAANGPTAETILDPAGTVRFHPLAVVATLDCDQAKW